MSGAFTVCLIVTLEGLGCRALTKAFWRTLLSSYVGPERAVFYHHWRAGVAQMRAVEFGGLALVGHLPVKTHTNWIRTVLPPLSVTAGLRERGN
jgi:hypothetical protein